MAGSSAGSIFVDLIARTAKYDDGFKKARKTTSDFERGIKSLSAQIAPLLGGAGFIAIANNALKAADGVAKLSLQLGLSTDKFQKYQYAAKLGGVESEKFVTAIGFLNNQIAAGKTPFTDTGQAIEAIADKLKNAKDGIERARIASEYFGAKVGRVMIPALIGGSENLIRLGEEAKKLGLVFTEKLTKDAEQFKDQLEILGEVFTVNFQASFLEGFVGKSGEIRDIYTDPKFIESVRGLGQAFAFIASTAVGLAAIPGILRDIFIEIPSTLGQGTGNFLGGRGFTLSNPHVSLQRPETVNEVTFINKETKKLVRTKEELTKAAKEQKKVEDELKRIYEETRTPLEKYNEAVAHLTELRAQLGEDTFLRAMEAEQKQLESATEKTNDIAEELGLTFRSAFEDAIVEGAKFRDVLKAIADDIFRLFIRKQVTEPAADLFSGLFKSGGGGIFDSLFGGLFGSGTVTTPGPLPWLGSFDSGLDHVPMDGLAAIHKNEAILNSRDAEIWRNGERVGNVYNFDARGADSSAIRRLEQVILANLGPGAIEHRMTDSASRGMA